MTQSPTYPPQPPPSHTWPTPPNNAWSAPPDNPWSAPPNYPQPPPRTDGFAIASLIFGVIGWIPMSVPFGFVALGRIRRGGLNGRGIAIAGLVLSAVWLIGAVSYLALNFTPQRNDAGAITNGGVLSIFDVRDGDCFDDSSGDGRTVSSVVVLPCTQPHDAQVLTRVTIAGTGSYPGDEPVYEQAVQLCSDRTDARLERSPIAGSVGLKVYTPISEGWARGDRTALCVAVADVGQKLSTPIGN